MLISLSFRNLFHRKTRTALTALGVAAGVATVMALTAIARGFRAQIDQMGATGGRADLVAKQAGAADPTLSYLQPETIERLRATEGVRAVHPVLLAIKQVPGNPFFFVYGVTARSPFLEQLTVVDGEGFGVEEIPEDTVLLGRAVARQLQVEVGDTLEVTPRKLRVIGIFDSEIPMISGGGITSLATAQAIAGHQRASFALLQVDDPSDEGVEQTRVRIEQQVEEVEAVRSAAFSRAFEEFELVDEMTAAISVLAILFGGIGVMNTLVMSVFERTREIGILRAIGWSRSMILRMFLTEGLVLCTVGGLVGIGLGMAGVEASSAVFDMTWLAANYEPSLFALCLGVALGMGLVGAAYPAYRAAKVPPVEALRYE